MQNIFPKMQRLMHEELHADERIVWSAAPRASRHVRRAAPAVVVGIVVTLFFVCLAGGAIGFKMPDFRSTNSIPLLFMAPFILIGLSLLSTPYWAARKAAATAYVITNLRVIIFEPGRHGGVSIRSFLPHQLSDIRRVQLADGSGDLILDKEITVHKKGEQSTTDIGFFGISDVRRVEAMVLELSKSISK